MRKKILNMAIALSTCLAILGTSVSTAHAESFQEHMEGYKGRGQVEIEDEREWYVLDDKPFKEREGVQIIRYQGHLFLKGENTTYTKQTDGTYVFHPKMGKSDWGGKAGIADVDEDYIVIDGAKYSTDGKTLLAIPFNETSFAVKEGTENVRMSAIVDYGDYNYGWADWDESDGEVVLENLTFPKTLKKIIFDDNDFFEWITTVHIKKVTLKNGNLSVDTISKLFRYFNQLKEKNLVVPKKYGGMKKEMLIYKKYLVKYLGSAKKVTVPKGVKGIADYAFSHFANHGDPDQDIEDKYTGCAKLKNVVLPRTVASIGEYAFLNCSHLEKVSIPKKSKLKKVKKTAFRNTKINYKKFMKKVK